MADFKEIIDKIFVNRDSYNEISDQDKIDSFFIINRKLGKQYPDFANKLNHKYIDKASAIDEWYNKFSNSRVIPKWYWDPKDRIKKTKSSSKSNFNYIKQREDLEDYDIEFLEKHFLNELKEEMKKLNKFEI